MFCVPQFAIFVLLGYCSSFFFPSTFTLSFFTCTFSCSIFAFSCPCLLGVLSFLFPLSSLLSVFLVVLFLRPLLPPLLLPVSLSTLYLAAPGSFSFCVIFLAKLSFPSLLYLSLFLCDFVFPFCFFPLSLCDCPSPCWFSCWVFPLFSQWFFAGRRLGKHQVEKEQSGKRKEGRKKERRNKGKGREEGSKPTGKERREQARKKDSNT